MVRQADNRICQGTLANGFRTVDKNWLKEQIHELTRKHFSVTPHLLKRDDWSYFQLVEIGRDCFLHGFWKYHDPEHLRHEPGNPDLDVIRDYYRILDQDLGSLLELIDNDTAVLIVSDHGARRLDGGFCVNEWLIREGYLVLNNDLVRSNLARKRRSYGDQWVRFLDDPQSTPSPDR